jgi:hypothetical protein
MSRLIPLGRIPKSNEDRQSLIAEQIALEERIANMGLAHVSKAVIDYLIAEKEYNVKDFDVNIEFPVDLDGTVFSVRSDIGLSVEGKMVLLVKCAMTSPDSWERYMIAMCRVASSEVIPFCLVTDGEHASLVDVKSGESIYNGFEHIPPRQEMLKLINNQVVMTLSPDKMIKEKRILFAFAGLACTQAGDEQ